MASSNSHRPSDKFVILGFLHFSSLLTWIKFVIKPCMHLVIIHLIWGLLRLGKESWNQTLRFWYLCTKYDNCHSSGRKASVIFVQLTRQLFASLNEQFHTWFCIVDQWRYYIYHFNSRENMQSCSLANAIQGTCSIWSRHSMHQLEIIAWRSTKKCQMTVPASILFHRSLLRLWSEKYIFVFFLGNDTNGEQWCSSPLQQQ